MRLGLLQWSCHGLAHQRTGDRGAARRHRPRAAAVDRRPRHGALDRGPRGRQGRGGRLADHGRLPDPQPLPAGGRLERRRARRRDRGRGRLRRPQRRGEGPPAAGARPARRAPRGRPGGGQERDLHRLRQGRRRQVDDDRQPRRRAAGRGPRDGCARRRRLRLLDPAHARRRPRPDVNAERKIIPPTGAGRDQGDVDRLLPRAERRGRLARADAPQGDPAVPRGRRLGGARLPAARPAARHRRRLDDPRPAAAAGARRRRHHPAAGRPERRPPRRRDGGQGRPRAARA